MSDGSLTATLVICGARKTDTRARRHGQTGGGLSDGSLDRRRRQARAALARDLRHGEARRQCEVERVHRILGPDRVGRARPPDAPARVRDAQRGDEARGEAGGDDGRVERAPEEERGGLSFIPDGAVTTVGWSART